MVIDQINDCLLSFTNIKRIEKHELSQCDFPNLDIIDLLEFCFLSEVFACSSSAALVILLLNRYVSLSILLTEEEQIVILLDLQVVVSFQAMNDPVCACMIFKSSLFLGRV